MFATFPILIFMMLLGVVFSAIVLRASCGLFNQFSGGYEEGYIEPIDDVRPEAKLNVTGPIDPNPFAAPAPYTPRKPVGGRGVPLPTFGKCLGIATILFVAGAFIMSLLYYVAESTAGGPGAAPQVQFRLDPVVFMLGNLVFNFFLTCSLLTALLPTRFGKAVLVTLIFFGFMMLVFGALAFAGWFLMTAFSSFAQ